jgi:hypothetical protein
MCLEQINVDSIMKHIIIPCTANVQRYNDCSLESGFFICENNKELLLFLWFKKFGVTI